MITRQVLMFGSRPFSLLPKGNTAEALVYGTLLLTVR